MVVEGQKGSKTHKRWIVLFTLLFISIGVIGFFGYRDLFSKETVVEKIEAKISFDSSVGFSEQAKIKSVLEENEIEINKSAQVSVKTATIDSGNTVLEAYVPITNFNAVNQNVSDYELNNTTILVSEGTDEVVRVALERVFGYSIALSDAGLDSLKETEIAFVPVDDLSSQFKLLGFKDSYYLDDFKSGAIFREVVFNTEETELFAGLDFELNGIDEVYKVNMSGVTALTRIMQRKLTEVGDPLYFSKYIGEFLADADLTHVSNEVSFKPGCTYSNVSFCSPPEFIETLKDSGVDLVEITGNHNNDRGSEYNTQTIELYKELGWGVVGGGLNSEEAAMSFVADTKGSKVAFLAYNYPDSPNGGAISGENKAGANSFDFEFNSIETDIENAKSSSDFVVVNVQFWECYSYPDGYIEFPLCDKPIKDQEETFKKIIDLGADMVIGSSAHQPQTYELYEGKPIYYGLGNLYFDQTSWPGTERGIILTHYFANGELLQTKLTPTVFDRDLQTRIMTDKESNYFLNRLHDAR